MRKVLIYHKRLDASFLNGGAFQPLMFAAALQKTCRVTLAFNWPADVQAVARMAGIELDPERIETVALSPAARRPPRFPYFANLAMRRRLKRLARDFDVCISTANLVDFGRPGHHFIYLLSDFGGHAFYDHLMKAKSRTGVKLLLRRAQTWLAENILKRLFGLRPVASIVRDPLETLYPASRWVEGVIESYYGAFNSRVFHPPTIFDFPPARAGRDPLLAIYVGRIFPPKRLTDLVRLVERAREATGKDLKFKIAGKLADPAYSAKLRSLAESRPWLELVGPVYGEEKERFMLSATFALHAERDEAFGIAIAEYLKAGLVPIVPDEGGPAEIVGDPALEFSTWQEGAEKLARLVRDRGFMASRLASCAHRAKDFTAAAYASRQAAVLASILASAPRRRNPSTPFSFPVAD